MSRSVCVVSLRLADLDRTVVRLMHEGRADGTWKNYRWGWGTFASFCSENRLLSLPASVLTVARFVASQHLHWHLGTIRNVLSAVALVHILFGLPDTTKGKVIEMLLDGIRRLATQKLVRDGPPAVGAPPEGKAPPALGRDVDGVVRHGLVARTKVETRNALMVAFGFYLVARPAALAALRPEFVVPRPDGLSVRVPPVKKETAFRERMIMRGADPASCPVRLYEKFIASWRPAVGGAFFQSAVQPHGPLDPATVGNAIGVSLRSWAGRGAAFTGYSPRRGAMTHGDRAGVAHDDLKRYGAWKSQAYEGYIDPSDEPMSRVAAALARR